MPAPYRFAIVGTRGIPARYGGFETFAEELSTRLAERGHRVSVYCRDRPTERVYRGVHLRYLPTIRHKYLDTIAHTLLSTAHLLAHRVDAALYCNAANAVFTWIPRLAGMPVALNVDGLERNRRKWNRLARGWYQLSEYLATFCPDVIVSDAQRIAEYYLERYRRDSVFIPYGAPVGKVETDDVLRELGLERGRYFLYVSRMEPENNALLVRQAFERVETDMPLVLVGDAPYADDYIASVRDTPDPRVRMPGAIYGAGYHELQSHCFAYIQATEVGGTHPALIEAMGRGALTLFLETPENLEVAGGAAIPFTRDNLAEKLTSALSLGPDEQDHWRRLAAERVCRRYSWNSVTSEYERLLLSLIGK